MTFLDISFWKFQKTHPFQKQNIFFYNLKKLWHLFINKKEVMKPYKY